MPAKEQSPFPESASVSELLMTQLELENTCTPVEIMKILEGFHALPLTVKPHMAKLAIGMRQGSLRVRQFTREPVAEHVTLYRGDHPVGTDANKALLICFTGNAHRVMMPISMFLQFVPESRFDLLLLRDPKKLNYLAGIPGYADAPELLLDRLQRDLKGWSRYEWKTCYGTSGGGAAALYAGCYLNVERAVSVGGQHASRSERLKESLAKNQFPPEQIGSLDRLIEQSASTCSTQFLAVFGADFESDRAGALSLQACFPDCRLHPIAGLNNHAIVRHLLETNAFQAFLDEHVLSDPRR
ncbi:MAG: hypothetical protein KDG50_09185 [Chromatiales bacterium]|nr:hypothetical protein [Chromatiales bacterium]